MSKNILSIPCDAMSEPLYSAIETVLSKIKQNYPRDFARIRKRVEKIITKQFSAEGCFSQADYQSKDDFEFLYEDHDFWEAQGIIIFHKSLFKKNESFNKKYQYKTDPYDSVLHTIAHEFGHAMANEKMFNQYFKQLFVTLAVNYSDRYEDIDFLATLNAAESIYALENIANFYAKKWGFPSPNPNEWFSDNMAALIRCSNGIMVEIQVDDKYNFKNSYIVHREWNESDLKKYRHIKHRFYALELLIGINDLNK